MPAEFSKILYGCCLSPNFWMTFSTTPLPPVPSPFIKAFYARDPPNSMLISQAFYYLKTASLSWLLTCPMTSTNTNSYLIWSWPWRVQTLIFQQRNIKLWYWCPYKREHSWLLRPFWQRFVKDTLEKRQPSSLTNSPGENMLKAKIRSLTLDSRKIRSKWIEDWNSEDPRGKCRDVSSREGGSHEHLSKVEQLQNSSAHLGGGILRN